LNIFSHCASTLACLLCVSQIYVIYVRTFRVLFSLHRLLYSTLLFFVYCPFDIFTFCYVSAIVLSTLLGLQSCNIPDAFMNIIDSIYSVAVHRELKHSQLNHIECVLVCRLVNNVPDNIEWCVRNVLLVFTGQWRMLAYFECTSVVIRNWFLFILVLSEVLFNIEYSCIQSTHIFFSQQITTRQHIPLTPCTSYPFVVNMKKIMTLQYHN